VGGGGAGGASAASGCGSGDAFPGGNGGADSEWDATHGSGGGGGGGGGADSGDGGDGGNGGLYGGGGAGSSSNFFGGGTDGVAGSGAAGLIVIQYTPAGGGGSDPCAGSPSPGAVCSDGTVYAGLSPDGNVAMYTTAADAPSSYSWSNVYTNTALTNCTNAPGSEATCKTGQSNSATLAGLGAGYAAATYCEGLTDNGHGDWYLPAQAELNVLSTNKTAIGGFHSGAYWSSSEADSGGAWTQYPNSGGGGGTMNYDDKKSAYRIRCVRR
jgi:hypothetical protein